MAYILAVLNEEYERLISKQKFYEETIVNMPRGSIQKKRINGKEYSYLCYRAGKKVITKYIPPDDLVELQEKIKQYTQAKIALKNIKENIRLLRNVVKNYP